MRVWINNPGQWAVDEKCVCGHLRSEHGSRVLNDHLLPIVRLENLGNCCHRNMVCECRRFRWAAWVFEK